MTAPARRLLLFAASVVLIMAATADLRGRAVVPYGEAWRWVHFTRSSGLPSDFVIAVAEVPDGSLWAVTRSGVSRFDGFVWKTYQDVLGLGTQPVSVSVDERGNLTFIVGGSFYVATTAGVRQVSLDASGAASEFSSCARGRSGPMLVLTKAGRLFEWDGATLRPHQTPADMGRVHSLRQGGEAVWASGEKGLWRFDGTEWRQRLQGTSLFTLAACDLPDGSALAYVDSPRASRGLWEWSGSAAPKPVRRSLATPVESIAVSPSGEVLLTHITGELMQRSGNDWVPFHYSGMAILDARGAGFLKSGDLWIATDHGLYVYRHTKSLWRSLSIPRPDDRNTVNVIVPTTNGRLLLGTGGGVAEASIDTPVVDRPIPPSDDIGTVTGLAVDGQGRAWATSGYSFTGARWRDASGHWQQAHLDPVLDEVFLHRAISDRHGGVWFLGLSFDPMSGIAKITDGPGAFRLIVSPGGEAPDRIERWGRDQGLPSGRVYGFAEGPGGEYWFATAGGVSRWAKGTWTHWNAKNGLKLDRVFCLAVDRNGDAWFGHQTWLGAGRIHGNKVEYFTEKQGLATDAVWEIAFDYKNRPWVAGEGGVSMLNEDGAWISFGPKSGLTHARFWPVVAVGDHMCLGSRGGGLTVLSLAEQVGPPPIVVAEPPAQDEDGFLVRWKAFAYWGEIPPDAVETRVRLDNGEWSPWSTARQQRFVGLSAGTHTIAFQAKGLLGTMNGTLAPVRFHVPPPLFARPLFFIPVAALAMLAAGLFVVIAVRQRRHHHDLHEREQQLTRTFQASPLATAVVALADGRYLEVNQAMERLVGRSREELLGLKPDEAFVLEADARAKALESLRIGRRVPPLPLRLGRDGDFRDLVAYVEPVEFAGARAILCQMLDTTEHKRLESQLRQAQKMESIGRLAGGVAHDFNNLLTVILGNASLLDQELPHGDPRRAELEQITIAGERAERLTRQLLAFARKQVVEPKVVNINEVVVGMDRMLRRLIGEDVELVTLPAENLDLVVIDPTQLEQVLMNLSVNARDAMPSGGTLTIRTQNVTITEREMRQHPEAAPGRFVRLSIADTGTGMDPQTLSRLFEPFFTTKEPGKGTGLGLATCYGIVRQAGGHILIESAPGRGSTFHVDLPPAPANRLAQESRESQVDARGGTETILLVEDETQVRTLAASVLRNRGYKVLEAGTGGEALEVADRNRGYFDLLVTDIVMPHMRGTELAVRLRAIQPALRVLYVSGYTDDDQFRKEAGEGRVAFLSKPFTPANLARKVREILDESPKA